MLDESNQNLSEAIKLYGQVVSQSNEQRALAARAQYRIGVLYERLGRKADAQRAFQTVVKQYGDQPEATRSRAKLPASVAKTKRPTPANENSAPTVRQIWAGSDVDTEGAPSPDGQFLSYMDKETGDLVIRNIGTTAARRLTKKAKVPRHHACMDGCAEESVWSPDGKLIAYGWTNQDGSGDLRVIGSDGSGERILAHNLTEYIEPFGWTGDGKFILVDIGHSDKKTDEIALIALADGSVRTIKTVEEWRYPNWMRISPDNRWIVYAAPQRPGAPRRDVYLLSVESKEEIPLIEHDADDYSIGWTPDGRGVLFISDRLTTFDVWFIAVNHGQPEGAPELVKRNVGNVEPMGITKGGALFYSPTYGAENNMRDVYIAKIDSSTNGSVSPPTLVASRYPGSNYTTAWSPDGRLLAMRSHTKPLTVDNGGDIILSIVSVDGKETRSISPKLKRMIGSFYWTRDGRSLFVAGSYRDWAPLTPARDEDRQGIYRVDPQTGDATPVILAPSGMWLQYPVPGVDGESLFYLAMQRSDGTAEIRIRNLKSDEDRSLFKTRAITNANRLPTLVSSLNVSPDGKSLAFTYELDDNYRTALMSMPLSGGEARELLRDDTTSVLQKIRGVAWTPDGKYIFFSRSSPNGRRPNEPNDLWRIPAQGGEPVKLNLTFPVLSNLSMNPDGHRLAFAAARPATREIWVMENFLPKQNPKAQSRLVVSRKR
jgi:Tol biopolymer transport system component